MRRLLPIALLLAVATTSTSRAQSVNDLRDFRVGMTVAAMKTDGYTGFACAAAPATKLQGWADFAQCPKEADGTHAVAFQYKDDPVLSTISDDGQGTKVAGQPVIISALISDAGMLAALHIETDPAVRLFTKRRADVFALQAMARYGDEGWTCTKAAPSPHEQPIGETFVKDHCVKTANGRQYSVDRMLFRDPDKPLKDFVSRSDVLIRRAGS